MIDRVPNYFDIRPGEGSRLAVTAAHLFLINAANNLIADATLRNSIHRASMAIIYMAIPMKVRRAIKTFLDVIVERVGDASAGLIILVVSISADASYKTYVHLVCVVLVLFWITLIQYLRSGYGEILRQAPLTQVAISPKDMVAASRAKQVLGD